ncbi:MAG TPA: lipoprotein insertase outer membrane protein LolB [Rudaea sp.]|nr:lipoprotein insertase outer membrane protein LolB [Rudaea sp.]
MQRIRAWRVVAGVMAGLALAACAPVRVRENPAVESAQTAREAALGSRSAFTISARIAVSNGNDGGSGELEWHQDGPAYTFTVHAPVTGKTWKLSGDARHAVLEGVEAQPLTGDDPERLLRERLGWEVPLRDLAAWVRGLRAAGAPAQLQYDGENRPAVIDQAGWKIEYRDWFSDRSPALPRKVFASRGTARVRMAIEQWSFDG